MSALEIVTHHPLQWQLNVQQAANTARGQSPKTVATVVRPLLAARLLQLVCRLPVGHINVYLARQKAQFCLANS